MLSFSGITSWFCKVIPNDMKPTQEELENIAQWCNDGHEGGAVQSTYLERLKIVMRRCSSAKYQINTNKGKKEGIKYNFQLMAENFVSLFHETSKTLVCSMV